jgi:hypothetical protein
VERRYYAAALKLSHKGQYFTAGPVSYKNKPLPNEKKLETASNVNNEA